MRHEIVIYGCESDGCPDILGPMIRYTLKCSNDHAFDSWFRNSEAFDTLRASKQITCSVCGDNAVEKAIMAPAVAGKQKPAIDAAPQDQSGEAAPLSEPSHPAEIALRRIRDHIRKNSNYVGAEFASEARKMHEGESEQRSIWGEATLADAKALHDDGIPVAPIPFISRQDD